MTYREALQTIMKASYGMAVTKEVYDQAVAVYTANPSKHLQEIK